MFYRILQCRKCADHHPNNGDEDECHGDDGDNLCCLAGLWLLHKIPDTLLIPSTFTNSKVFSIFHLKSMSLLFHLGYQQLSLVNELISGIDNVKVMINYNLMKSLLSYMQQESNKASSMLQ